MANKLIIDWKEYNLIVEKLAIQIYKSGFKPDMLIGIMRGGAPIIDVLSRVFKLKCAYLAVESYSGDGTEDKQGELVFSREMSSTVQEMKGNLLLFYSIKVFTISAISGNIFFHICHNVFILFMKMIPPMFTKQKVL